MINYFELNGISKTYIGGYVALNHLSLTADKDSLTAVVGEKKSGKSTLLSVIAGLESIDNGSIYLDDEDITNIKIKDRNIGYLPCELPYFNRKNVDYNIKYAMTIRKADFNEYKDRYERIVEICGLNDKLDLKGNALSVYDKIVVSLARLFLIDRKLYLIDNIFDMVDEVECDRVVDIVRKLAENKTVLCAVGNIKLAKRLNVDKVVLLAYGTVVDSGKISESNGFNNTVASLKLVNGKCDEVECDICDNAVKIANISLTYNRPLFQNVFRKGVFVLPNGNLKVGKGRFCGTVSDMINDIIYLDCGENQVRFYADVNDYNIGDVVYFDFEPNNFDLYDLGSERKITK